MIPENSSNAPPADPRPGWSATGMMLLAIAALYFNAPKLQVWLLALGGVVLAANLTTIRLPDRKWMFWFIRAALFFLIITNSGPRRGNTTIYGRFFDTDYLNLFGLLCAAELCIQLWRARRTGPPGGEIILLSGLILSAGLNTFVRRNVWWIAPAFTLCLIGAMRHFRPGASAQTLAQRARSWPKVGLAAALSLVLGLGLAMAIRRYAERVTIYPFARMFHNSAGARVPSGPPRLESSPNMPGTPLRVLRIDGLGARPREMHLRGMAYDSYVNGGWEPIYEQRRFVAAGDEMMARATGAPRLRITRINEDAQLLLHAPLNVASINPLPGGNLECSDQLDLKAWSELPLRYSYEIAVPADELHGGPLRSPLHQEQRHRCLAVPSTIDPRVIELAEQLASSGDAPDKIDAVCDYLMNNHAYSTEVQLGGGDPLSDFLLNKRSAHCQFFASAAVILLRSAGVPARYVTGYYAHERSGDDSIVVRLRDAHAWAEAWVDGAGWITVDATPGDGRPNSAFAPVGRWDRFKEWLEDKWAGIKAWLLQPDWVKLAMYAIALAVALAGLRSLASIRVRRHRKLSAAYPDHELLPLARRFEKLLRRGGVRCAPSLTWREQLSGLGAHRSDRLDLPAAQRFGEAYDSARFGQHSPTTRASLEQLLTNLERGTRTSSSVTQDSVLRTQNSVLNSNEAPNDHDL